MRDFLVFVGTLCQAARPASVKIVRKVTSIFQNMREHVLGASTQNLDVESFDDRKSRRMSRRLNFVAKDDVSMRTEISETENMRA